MSAIGNFHDSEPAVGIGLLTFVGGFLAQIGPGSIGSLKALGTSAAASGLQAVLSREKVVSPQTAAAVKDKPLGPGEVDSGVAQPWSPMNSEPSLVMAIVAGMAAFLLQVVGHTNLLQALGTSGGIAGLQGLLTRQRAWAPGTVSQSRLSATLRNLAGPTPGASQA